MWHLLAAILIGFVYYGGPAAADDKLVNLLPTPDPPGKWRLVASPAEMASSQCIARAETPLCLIEADIACLLRVDRKRCRVAFWPGRLPDLIGNGAFVLEFNRYRVLSAGFVHDRREIPRLLRDGGPEGPREGDAIIHIFATSCSKKCNDFDDDKIRTLKRFFRHLGPTTYILRQMGDRWTIVGRTVPPSGVTTEAEFFKMFESPWRPPLDPLDDHSTGPAALDATTGSKLEDVLPLVDPPSRWRVLTIRDETSTSTCIGRVDTPLCMIETQMACLLRFQRDLCDAAYWPSRRFVSEYEMNLHVPESHHYRYRVVDARYIKRHRDQSVRAWGAIENGPRIGATMLPVFVAVTVRVASCHNDACRKDKYGPKTLILRKWENRWIYTGCVETKHQGRPKLLHSVLPLLEWWCVERRLRPQRRLIRRAR
ncbi:MAG: hypothetical protein HY246_11575 [Proteobacteria bacterium]|nr:hypothetical protein [Pseudomonadota bacterium]